MRNKTKELVAQYLKYPQEAIDAGQEGVAVIGFVVRKDGSVSDMEIVENPGYGMGEAAQKAVKKLNKMWSPGKDRGEPVSVQMKVPVHFVLPTTEQPAAPAPAIPDVYFTAEVMPQFGGCATKEGKDASNCTRDSMVFFMREHLKYPEAASSAGVEGMVETTFVVDETGSITNVEVMKGIGSGCDEEAVRLINSLPKFSPGMQDGQPVKVRMNIPVMFRLPAEEE